MKNSITKKQLLSIRVVFFLMILASLYYEIFEWDQWIPIFSMLSFFVLGFLGLFISTKLIWKRINHYLIYILLTLSIVCVIGSFPFFPVNTSLVFPALRFIRPYLTGDIVRHRQQRAENLYYEKARLEAIFSEPATIIGVKNNYLLVELPGDKHNTNSQYVVYLTKVNSTEFEKYIISNLINKQVTLKIDNTFYEDLSKNQSAEYEKSATGASLISQYAYAQGSSPRISVKDQINNFKQRNIADPESIDNVYLIGGVLGDIPVNLYYNNESISD